MGFPCVQIDKMSVEMSQKPCLSLNVYSKNIGFLIHIPPIFFSFSNLSQDSSLINGRLILVLNFASA